MLKFVTRQASKRDILMVSDGRSRNHRLSVSKHMLGCRNIHEAWIVYQTVDRINIGRRVAFSADNKEMLTISLPVPRTSISANPRRQFNASGETSAHETTYTGVVPIPWNGLPLIKPSAKQDIIGFEPAVPSRVTSQKGFDPSAGVPLFWHERKTKSLWKQILKDYCVGCVFDVTPGSGQAAVFRSNLFQA